MKTAMMACACLALLAAGWLCGEAALTARTARALPAQVLTVADQRLASIERTADRRLASLEARAAAELARTRTEVLRRVDTLVERGDARLGQAIEIVDSRSRETSAAVGATSSTLAAAIEEYRRLPAVVGARLDPWTDCRGNGACWQAQFTASLGSARYTMGQIARAAPAITESVKASTLAAQQTAQAASVTAQNAAVLTTPTPKWVRWTGVGLGLAASASQVALPFAIGRGVR